MYANFDARTIVMSKNEAKAAGKIGTTEFNELKEYMMAYPGFVIQIKAPAKRKVEFRGLDYEYMKAYIQKHDDENGTIMAEFDILTAQDKKRKVEGAEHLEAANYFEVRDWFLAKFPEIRSNKKAHSEQVKEILKVA